MATQYWVGADSSWNTAANWASSSGGSDATGPPASGDAVIFDGGDVTSCTCDVAFSIASLNVQAGYSGKLDFADSSYAHAISGDVTFDGVGEVDCGNSTITCGGNWDNADQTTWTYGTSTVVLTGTSKTLTTSANRFYNFTISGSYTNNNGGANTPTITGGVLTISGTVTGLGDLTILDIQPTGAAGLVVTSTGSVTQDDIIINGHSAGTASLTIDTGATWSIDALTLYANVNVNKTGAGTLTLTGTGAFQWQELYNGGKTLKFGAGDFLIGTAATFNQDKAAQTSTIDLATNNANLTFQNSVTIQETSTLVWSAGTGIITLSGTANGTITTPAGWTDILEDIVINKGNSTAKVTLAGDVYTQSFTGTQGRFDLNGNTLFSDGNVDIDTVGGFQFHNGTDNDMSDGVTNGKIDLDGGTLTLDGTSGTHLVIDNLDFDLAAAVTGAATFCDVVNSTCTYVTSEIDATDASNTDNGGNVGWNFSSGYTLTALSGSYAVSGTAANLLADRKLTASAGAYSLAGTSASLLVDRSISVQPGSYAITGTASSLLVDRTLSVGAGSYSIAGAGVGLQHDRQLTAVAGSYSVAGTDANLIYSGAGAYVLGALPGAYGISGVAANLMADRQLVAQSGAYSLAGAAADLLMSRVVVANPGTYAVTGSLVDLRYDTGTAVPMEIGHANLMSPLAIECELRSALTIDCEIKQSLDLAALII